MTLESPPISPARPKGQEYALFEGSSEQRARCEKELEESGCAIPLRQRMAWHDAHGTTSFLLATRRGGGPWCYGISVEALRTRSVPGHWVWRVERLRSPEPLSLMPGLLEHLAHRSREASNVLRVNLELFALNEAELEVLAEIVGESLFQPCSRFRGYRNSLLIDLRKPEEELFAELSRNARRECRIIEREPLEIRDIVDDEQDECMDALLRETWARTGEKEENANWPALRSIANGGRGPARLLGLFDCGEDVGSNLLAIALCEFHGDHAAYSIAATTRRDDLKATLGAPLLWEQIRWAQQRGAAWFDLGGIEATAGDQASARTGISVFKRKFSRNVVRVGSEWVYAPHPLRNRVAEAVTRSVNRVRALLFRN